MAVIENTVGELPYQLTDFDQHSDDWPHAEGLREPADFYDKVEGLDDVKKRNFLRENGIKLTEGTN
jgi:hypothetical protein